MDVATVKRGRPRRTDERYTDSHGYVQVRVGDVYVPEHQLVLMAMLGRPLHKGEIAYHRNLIRDDNDPDNIELRVRATWISGAPAEEVTCPNCGLVWATQPKGLVMSVDEVARRIVDGDWSASPGEGDSGISAPFRKNAEVVVRVAGRRRRSRRPGPGQSRLFIPRDEEGAA